ncbi:uncharacterized protein G2W53_009813 [Senna tora]|uniref:Uncharacterized protein n=1 Tax=Senna tora TaxID=362788 RepID=A0A834WYM5_9FABA|nr:uncharacterized protein G2W53_009813 [Senna tora]
MLRFESSWHGRSVDRVLTCSGRQIAVGSHKPSRITRQKTRCASESNTSVRVVFANRSSFDAPIRVVLAWEERGSCLNIFRTKIAVGSQKPSRITRQKTRCANDKSRSDLKNLPELRDKRLVVQVSQTRRFALYSRTGVVLMLQLESSWHGRSVDRVLTYSGRQIAVGSHEPSELRGKTLVAQVSQTRRFALYSRTRVVLMLRFESSWHARSVDRVLIYSGRQIAVGSHKPSRITWHKTRCASESNTSTTNRGRILENLHELRGKRLVAQVSQTRQFALHSRTGVVLMLRLESSWHGRSVDRVLTYSGRQIAVGSQKPSRITRQKTCCARAWIVSKHIPDEKSRSNLRNLHELRGKRLVAQMSQTRRFELYSRTGVVLILRFESSWHGRSVDRVLTYSGRQIAFGSKKPSRITRQKTRCASESNTSVRVVFANLSSFDAPIGVVLAWESVDRVLTYSGRQIAVGFQKRSRITRQKTRCASESNTSVRVAFANRSGFDAPIGVVLAWEERGSCLNIFGTTNRGRIS